MNTFGRIFRISIFGESHGPAIGVTIDGVSAGMPLTVNDFLPDLKRRQSGAKGTTPRVEEDMPEIVSGWMNGHTTGAPLTILSSFGWLQQRTADWLAAGAVPCTICPHAQTAKQNRNTRAAYLERCRSCRPRDFLLHKDF